MEAAEKGQESVGLRHYSGSLKFTQSGILKKKKRLVKQ